MFDRNENIETALQAVAKLDEMFKQTSGDAILEMSSDERARLAENLEAMILRRIEVANAFEWLARLDRPRATNVLLRRYLGRGVCPDNKFGGYESELSTMLEDFVEVQGIEALSELVVADRFDSEKVSDSRVARAFAEVVGCPPEDVSSWVELQQVKEKTM